MNHNNRQRERWVAVLAALTFVFGFGVMVGHTGFRVDAGALGNVFGVTPHQWGVLLSGLVGSVAGGAVAVWVLRRTIEHQEENHRLQLRTARGLHSEQLEAQKSEATRERAHVAAAGILSGLWLVNRASKASAEQMSEQIDSIILAAHSLRLEREHTDLAQTLMQMIGELEETPEVVAGNQRARKELLQITARTSAAIVVWFQAADKSERRGALDSIRRAKEATASLVRSCG
ncbi:hypothetical protein [Arthrobacter sp. NPDC058192]|uniref:hypothetical protein n=1 Tax=Arthrobacter sp. NPDC058192 TaxID=3346372 RepID=UPI0036E647A0